MNEFAKLDKKGKYQQLLELSGDLSSDEERYWYITALSKMGKLDEALKFSNQYAQSLHKMEKKWQGKILNRMGAIYWRKGELNSALNYYKRGLEKCKEVTSDKDIATVLNNIGIIYHSQGKLNLALDFYQRSLNLYKSSGNQNNLAASNNNIGAIHYYKGELYQAQTYFEKTLELSKKVGNKSYIALSMNNLGEIFSKQGDLVKSLEFFTESFKLRKEVDNKVDISKSLFNLVKVYILTGQIEKAQKKTDQLKELVQQTNEDKNVKIRYDFSFALLKKSSNRLRDKVKAQQIFEKIIKVNDFDFELLIEAIFQLLELLIMEYKSFNEPTVLEEIIDRTNQVYKTAQAQHMYATVVDVLTLKSRLAIIQNKFDKSNEFLTQALLFAKEKNMPNAIKKVNQEKSQLESELQSLKKMIKSSDVAARLEKSRIKNYIKRLKSLDQ